MKYSILALLAAAATISASAQRVEIVEEKDGQPTGTTQTMSGTADGNFHTGILNLTGGTHRFHLLHHDGSDSEPLKISPEGHKEFSATENDFYDYSPSGSFTYTPKSTAVGSTKDFADFDLWTDKAIYPPGQSVWIEASKYADFPGAIVRYRHGTQIIGEHPLVQMWWEWKPPTEDFRGYLVDVYRLDEDGNEEILGSIGVDVSSDWIRFPRNGYTAWYEPGRLNYIGGDVAFLNRRHINAVQFQDWHWKHHRPYNPDETYHDIANREISAPVVRGWIETMHNYNMKTFFYNLGYGALERAGAAEDGVKEEWYYYKDRNHQEKDYHILPADWMSNITFTDPGNEGWQNYLNNRNDEVYSHFDFDGFQVDQVGYRGDTYDYYGNQIYLWDRYPLLLQAFKKHHPDKRLIMNSVSNHGCPEIASSGVIDVCYNEIWSNSPGEDQFHHLYSTAEWNRSAGGNDMRTVFACYMNYNYAGTHGGGEFNLPGILMTDACMFAMGAAHLELGAGGNMLCNEYFPNTSLHLSTELQNAITRYYDFITAYENYIYDTEGEFHPAITSRSDHPLTFWHSALGPQARHIVIHGRKAKSGATVLHLINFMNANSLSWRDVDGTMNAPIEQTDITLDIDTDRMVTSVWAATPDSNLCVPTLLPFTQTGRTLTVTVPSLLYWTMLVIE